MSPHGTEPPVILALSPSLKALAGEDVTLECWVFGVPPPYIAWYKGETGSDLGSRPPPRRDIRHGVPWGTVVLTWGPGTGEQAVATFPPGTQRAVLRLQAVREEDAGRYSCEGLSEAGVAFDSTVLDVGGKCLPLLSCPTEPTSLLPLQAHLPLAAFQGSSCPQFLGFAAWEQTQYKQADAWQDFRGLGGWMRLSHCQKTSTDAIAWGRGSWGLNWECKAQAVGIGRRGGWLLDI